MNENDKDILTWGDRIYLKNDEGPIAFGYVTSAAVVSWSGGDSRDLITSRMGGVNLYPSKELNGTEQNREPAVVCETGFGMSRAFPVDWDKDGKDDLIVTDTAGFIYLYKRKGEYPDLSFEFHSMLRDKKSGLPFNIPLDNPFHTEDDLDGYTDTYFYSALYVLAYPRDGEKSCDLIIGDWSGNLWWLPDISEGDRGPEYTGTKYRKPESNAKAMSRNSYREIYGYDYVKPAEKICDVSGEPFLLGDGVDGEEYFLGSNVKPVNYLNRTTGSRDLLVYAGSYTSCIYYLQRAGTAPSGRPVFKNMGKVDMEGFGFEKTAVCRAYPVVYTDRDGWNDLLIANVDMGIVKLRNKRLPGNIPGFVYDGVLCAKDSPASGINYTEMLTDRSSGRRYLLECNYYFFECREILDVNGGLRLSHIRRPIEDQHGVFKIEGETDPNLKEWGWHIAVRWDYDNSGSKHLLIGADTGYLYLLRDNGQAGVNGKFFYESFGPLKDKDGRNIRIHNRACPACIDLNGDGREDVIVGGASYQCGAKTDPRPGGGIYYCINMGTGSDGLPILSDFMPLAVKGHDFEFLINDFFKIQAYDIDKDGEKEIILSVRSDGYKARVYKTLKDEIGLVYTGYVVPDYVLSEYLADIDGDGETELVFAGDECGFGWYKKMMEDRYVY